MLIEKIRMWFRYSAGSKILKLPQILDDIKVDANTFFLWEPSSRHHTEVLPGYAKYLLDLGFRVYVFTSPHAQKRGLFERFRRNDNLKILFLTQRQIVRYFINHGLGEARGILITSARKLGLRSYSPVYQLFKKRSSKQKILLVEHDIKLPVDKKYITPEIITLNKTDYKNTLTTVVNPHYFGETFFKNEDNLLVRFIIVGVLKNTRYSLNNLVEAVLKLYQKGIDNFQITIIGDQHQFPTIPVQIQNYFIFLGSISFDQLYDKMDESHYLITLFDESNRYHQRYLTTASSGNIQLVFGFTKPCIISERFASHYGLNPSNAIIHTDVNDLSTAMIKAITLDKSVYFNLKYSLDTESKRRYSLSLDNLRNIINN